MSRPNGRQLPALSPRPLPSDTGDDDSQEKAEKKKTKPGKRKTKSAVSTNPESEVKEEENGDNVESPRPLPSDTGDDDSQEKAEKKKTKPGKRKTKSAVSTNPESEVKEEENGDNVESSQEPSQGRRGRRGRAVAKPVSQDEGEVSEETTSQPKPKKKTKPKEKIGTSRETLMNTDDGTPVKKVKKKKKKVEAQLPFSDELEAGDLGLAANLDQIQDDVVDANESQADVESTHMNAVGMRSEPASTLFIERKNGFKAADKQKLARRLEEQQKAAIQTPVAPTTQTTIQLGLVTHRIFKTITLFCHGIFAGFALWHMVMGITLLAISGEVIFLNYYHTMAQPIQTVYYLFFVLVTVSSFDRYDVSCVNRRFLARALTLQNGAIACLFYVVGLILSLSMTNVDDKISLYKIKPLLWTDPQVMSSDLQTWRNLNIARGVAAILGWLVISLRPNTDRLTKNLQKAEDNRLAEELGMVSYDGVA